MSLRLEDKKIIIEDLARKVAEAEIVVVAEYRGVSVSSITELRRQARAQGVFLRVLKNTLVRRVLADTSFSALVPQLVGPLIYGVSSDPVAASKVFFDFAKTNDFFVIKAASLSDSLLSVADVKALAELPSRDVLLSNVLATMNAPISCFVSTLNEIPTSLVRVLSAVTDLRQAS